MYMCECVFDIQVYQLRVSAKVDFNDRARASLHLSFEVARVLSELPIVGHTEIVSEHLPNYKNYIVVTNIDKYKI